MRLQALVKEIMNKDVKSVSTDASVRDAAEVMAENRIGSVIVVGEKKVKGIVTAEDIVFKYVAEKRGDTVSDIMTRELVTISPSATIEKAARLMSEHKIKKLPVMDGDILVGIITASDIAKVEPALYEVLLETMKMQEGEEFAPVPKGSQFIECEVCGNYGDDITEVDGVYICNECEELKERLGKKE